MPHPREQKPVIGLVGGIGAGKSTAAGEFAKLGCALIDADAIGRELLATPRVRDELGRRWGGRIFQPDGGVDRKSLGRIVFEDPDELEALNGIMWPLIRRRIEQQLARARGDSTVPAVVLDAAIMLEAGWDELCTHLLFVDAPERVRASRAAERGWHERTWRRREKSQISLDSKARRCYASVDNSSSVSHLRKQVRQVFNRIVRTAGRP